MKVNRYPFPIPNFFIGILCFSILMGEVSVACDSPSMTAESCLEAAQRSLDQWDHSLSLNQRKVLKDTPLSEKNFLSPSLRLALENRSKLKEEKDFWIQTVHLKKSILDLNSQGEGSQSEADLIARTAIRSFEEQKKKYGMIRPAVLQNAFINTGLKKEGFCWHWARDLLKQLRPLDLKFYTIQWGTAYEGKIREHNCLVVIPRGGQFESGLVLDGWRHSGKAYWIRVQKDHYPWKPGAYAGDE